MRRSLSLSVASRNPLSLAALGAVAFAGLAALVAPPAHAAGPLTFGVSPAGINRVAFESDAPIETITGVSTKVRGEFQVDLAHPDKTTGSVKVPVKSIGTGNSIRDGHLQNEQWLNAAAYPDITFSLDGLDLPKGAALAEGAKFKGKGHGKITIKGHTKAITLPTIISFHKNTPRLQKLGIKGDIIRVKAKFKLTLKDFGVVPPEHIAGLKVANEVTITVRLTAVQR